LNAWKTGLFVTCEKIRLRIFCERASSSRVGEAKATTQGAPATSWPSQCNGLEKHDDDPKPGRVLTAAF